MRLLKSLQKNEPLFFLNVVFVNKSGRAQDKD